MSELYTTQTRLKMALNGGAMPPMTPLTESAMAVIEPAYTIGMGALHEDSVKGLRCPVRGCGKYFHYLSRHLNQSHRGLGGAHGIRAALSIQSNAPLLSASALAKAKGHSRHFGDSIGWRKGKGPPSRRNSEGRRPNLHTVGHANLHDKCVAQTVRHIEQVAARLGRTPSYNEIGQKIRRHAVKYFGSWSATLDLVGLAHRKGRIVLTHDEVCAAYERWHSVHRRLPSAREADHPERSPWLPGRLVTVRTFGVKGWPEAMSHVAWILGLDQEKTA